MRLLDMVDSLLELVSPDDSTALSRSVKDLITLRNGTDHQLAVCAAALEVMGVARQCGPTTTKLLQANGAAPSSAYRWMRIGLGLGGLDRTAAYHRRTLTLAA